MSHRAAKDPDPAKTAISWIAVDWGTTNLRAFAMSAADAVCAEANSAEGMGGLSPEEFEPALLRLIGGWLPAPGLPPMPVVVCGMAGARGGWVEAPYRAVPGAPVAPGETVAVATHDRRIAVEIVPGLRQNAPADVMRGEETQIAGFLADAPEFNGLLILPGSHSKHVHVAAGRVARFATHMTGELFAALTGHTVLARTMAAPSDDDSETDFNAGLEIGRAGGALAALFPLRAEALLDGLSPERARARLSGLLIGAELVQVAPGQSVVIIGAGPLARRYAHALARAGITARLADGAALARRGLAQARRRTGR